MQYTCTFRLLSIIFERSLNNNLSFTTAVIMRSLILIYFLFTFSFLQAQIISTFAGNGTPGSSGNGGIATSAQIFDPQTVCSDIAGNIYIADHGNHVVRKVDAAGIISIFAGTGTIGNTGDGGPATSAQLSYPYGICFDNVGNFYISDRGSNLIRKINTSGIISTIAGSAGIFGHSGDGGLSAGALLSAPCGICTDNAGNIYFAEFGTSIIRKISTAGIISTVAGIPYITGGLGDGGLAINAWLSSPTGVSVDANGNIYIADMGNCRIRKVNSAGIITNFAGGLIGYTGDGGPAVSAQLKFPYFVLVTPDGKIYISDTGNHVVRVVGADGIISTVVGTGVSGYSGDGGLAILATLMSTGGICFDNTGSMYIPDGGNFVIRKVSTCITAALSQQPASSIICNTGNTSFSVVASNASVYLWQMNNGSGWTDLSNNSTYSSTATNTMNITGATLLLNGMQYRCKITNVCGSIFSAPATLTVNTLSAPALNIVASNTIICSGSNVIFTAYAVNGGSSPTYQWKKNGNITGSNTSVYTDNGLVSGDIISCTLISNSTCATTATAESNSITVSVSSPVTPVVSITSTSNNICFSTPVTFNASALNGGVNPVYRWQKNNVDAGTNQSFYTDNNLNNADVIKCFITSDLTCVTAPSAASNSITMTINSLLPVTVAVTASNNSVCLNMPVTFSANATNAGSSPVYQWKRNGLPEGTNSAFYTNNNFVTGDMITCTTTSSEACTVVNPVTSDPVPILIYPSPLAALDHSSTLCKGSTRVLDPGNFSGYLWNNGSTAQTLTTATTGEFYVTVTDSHNCTGRDTVRITTLLEKPSDFLPEDIAICSYESMILKSIRTGFIDYLWNTNEAQPEINISKAGMYWLQVTDQNHCTGRDTINVIAKQCINGFYIPSAFTPNGDGKNDIFKPAIYGNIKNYTFIVYNRWGQTVFFTHDSALGWNGTLKNDKQNNGIFIWTCTFNLNGEELQIKKGSVLMIR
jgi:gliding motility-associated-like protein